MKFNKRTKVFVTGAGGMLGSALVSRLAGTCRLLATSRQGGDSITTLDIRKTREVTRLMEKFRPDIVFHLAALTNPEYCQAHPNEAKAVNVSGTKTLVSLCRRRTVPLVFVSSSGIFDGTKRWYTERDVPHPITIYGKTKYAGEVLVRSLKEHYIFRPGWMIGGKEKDKKFVGAIMRQIQDGRKELYAVNDKFGTISYTEDVIVTMLAVIAHDAYGLYHVTNRGSASRYDVAQQIVRIFKRPIRVYRKPSSFFRKAYFVERPQSERLRPDALVRIGLYDLDHWKQSLAKYLRLWQ